MNNPLTILFGLIMIIGVFILTEYPKIKEFNDGLLRIYFLDVGQGDASLIRLPSKKVVLIDSGPSAKTTEVVSNFLPFTHSKIDLAIITHSHADHITGFIDILDNYEVGCLVYNMDDAPSSETEEFLRQKISDLNIKVVESAKVNECFNDSDITISNFAIQNTGGDNQNLESIVTLLKYQSFEALFTGDAETEVQTQILPQINADIEVLKVPHQGSSDSLYPPLLHKLKPNYAVFSVGEGNSHGHPHKEVIEEYLDLGIKFDRTDEVGTVEVATDGQKWSIGVDK